MNRLSEEKAQAIAAAYCSNGLKKVEALLEVGYSVTYANNGGLKLFDNVRVKANITKIRALAVAKTGWDIEQSQTKLLHAYEIAEQYHQPSAMVSAVVAVNRTHGLDKDASADIEQEELTKTQAELGREIAQQHFRGPQLAQDGRKEDEGKDMSKKERMA